MQTADRQPLGEPLLLVVSGADQGKVLRLEEGTWRIGRGRQNDLKLRDTEVSRQHAVVLVQNGTVTIKDVGSSNGTYVNGVRVTEARLKPGDQIHIGRTTLVLHHAAPTVATAEKEPEVQIVPGTPQLDASAIVRGVLPSADTGTFVRAGFDEAELKAALASLNVLYEVSKAVSQIGDMGHLLDQILKLVLASVPAEQAAVLLLDGNELRPYAARTRRRRQDTSIRVSRTIVDYVLSRHEGVLTTDASQDERFAGGLSVQQFSIRQAICVPMEGRHDLVGVLYMDKRAGSPVVAAVGEADDRFTEHHLLMALAIGRIAALAIEETRYYQALLRAERLAAIGQAMAALSHHIKNILQGFRTGEAVLELGLKQNKMALVQQGWAAVKRSQERILHLVMDMLSYSKDRTPLWEQVDANALAREVVEAAQARAAEVNARVVFQPSEEAVLCYLDQQAIHQVLLNLVLNALDALEGVENGEVVVRVELAEDRNTLSFFVIDNGPGIPPEIQRHIFSPFFSTKGSRGTGLGLAVSEKIVREHDGEIRLVSEPGKGAQFEVRLPLHRTLPESVEESPHSDEQIAPPTLLQPIQTKTSDEPDA